MPAIWSITNKWPGAQPYSFDAALADDGSLTVVDDPSFFGVWVAGEGSTMTLAIANSNSITSYTGAGPADSTLQGSMVGWSPGTPVAVGTWSGYMPPPTSKKT